MRSGIQLLADVTRGKRMKAIIGDMKELGRYALTQHRALGKLLCESGVQKAIVVGEFAPAVVEGAVKAGMKPSNLICTANADEAIEAARKVVKAGDTVLLKGSRAVGLERVFERW
jgi:UDP-N-acetylmuramoyl-tripeptide--D-alanyl-D-alanine ligase